MKDEKDLEGISAVRYKGEVYSLGNRRNDLVELWKDGTFQTTVKISELREVKMMDAIKNLPEVEDDYESAVIITQDKRNINITCCLKLFGVKDPFVERHTIIKLDTSQTALNCEVARIVSHLFYRISENVETWEKIGLKQS